MTTYTRTVPEARFSTFRRQLLRNGGAIVVSAPVLGGFQVTYVARVGA